ncbi:MAG: MEMO1 family protein [Nitrospinaceae bacterium]|nr:MAG: MEMO1 family protein [Nitrospinaceae bacterium]
MTDSKMENEWMVRKPAVAGQFYPADSDGLKDEIKKHTVEGSDKIRVIGIVSPHAGFMYCGDAAGAVYSRIEIPETVVLIGPNHTGRGQPVSVMTEGTWSMPFGDLQVDRELAESICDASSRVHADSSAHQFEHSLETQLPFLQYFRKQFKIVPICLKPISFKDCEEVSRAILMASRKTGRQVLMVASSDMTHYESHESASQKDKQAIERIVDRDAQGLYHTVEKNHITMCGVNPVTVMLLYANEMGASRSELIKYMTSGDVTGDFDQVVGYAGMIVR